MYDDDDDDDDDILMKVIYKCVCVCVCVFYSLNLFVLYLNLNYLIHLRVAGQIYNPNWQKESWQTFKETSGYVRPEKVNKWPNSTTDVMMMTF